MIVQLACMTCARQKMDNKKIPGVQSKKLKVQGIQAEHRNFKRIGQTNSYCSSWHDPTVFNVQTNPCLFQIKQLGASFQNVASKSQWKLSTWPRTQKEKTSRPYCFTLCVTHFYSPNNLYCRAFNRGIFWDIFSSKKFSDCQIVKDCCLASPEIYFTDTDNKDVILKQIKGLQLSYSPNKR